MAAINARIQQNLSFLKQTIAPRTSNMRPPPLQQPSSMFKLVDIDETFRTTTVLDVLDGVRADTGIIIWLTLSGVANIIHYGIAPKDSWFPQRNGAPTSSIPVDDIGIQSFMAGDSANANITTSFGIDHFIFSRALNLPRTDEGWSVKITPDLSQDFSLSRSYGGILELQSTTTNQNNNVLNGYMTTAVVSDTRDVAQSKNGFADCYSVIDISQAARTSKESVKNVQAQNGVIQLQGPDIAQQYTQPIPFSVDQINGSWQSLINNGTLISSGSFSSNTLVVIPMRAGWVSPWGVQQYEKSGLTAYPAGGTFGLNGDPVAMDTVSENVCTDVRLQTNVFTDPDLFSETDSATYSILVGVDFYYARVVDSTNGITSVRKITTSKTYVQTGKALQFNGIDGDEIPANNKPGLLIDEMFSPASEFYASGGTKVIGKFIGFRPYVLIQATSLTTTTPSNFIIRSNVFNLSVRARDIYQLGATGPAHILRYDDLGEGQNVHCWGVVNSENVAKADLAPYVQGQIQGGNFDTDVNVYTLLYALYNGRSRFKSSWSRKEYQRMIMDDIYELTPDKILSIGDTDQSVQGAAEASGLFSTLGNLGGSIVGGLIGQPGLGGQIGGAIGGLGDDMLGGAFSAGEPYHQGGTRRTREYNVGWSS